MLKIAIVDDHLLFRKSLSLVINAFNGMQVVLDADNGKTFLEKVKKMPIDIVLLDIQMPVMNGYEVCRELKKMHPEIKILIVSQLTAKQSIHKVIELGAHGYFTKNADPEQLDIAIRSIVEKGYYFNSELGSVMRDALAWEKNGIKKTIAVSKEVMITPREIEIIKLICQEYSSEDIGNFLFIEKRTVESHRTNIMKKTKSHNIIGIVLYALKHKLISLDQL